MTYDFDQLIDRRNTDSLKWEYLSTETGPVKWDATDPGRGDDQTLAMWVADMDFRCARPVIEAIEKRTSHGIFGYSIPGER
jgi:cysteine-S-conjugate beta-lyase